MLFALMLCGVAALPSVVGAQDINGATLAGDIGAIRRLLDSGVSPNAYNQTGFAPIHSASRQGRVDIVRLLLDRGADADIQSRTRTDGGQAALHIAARNNYLELIQLLLARGADPNIQDNRGNTPLHDAAIGGQRTITRALVRAGADTDTRNREGESAVEVASSNLRKADFSRLKSNMIFMVSPQLDFDDLADSSTDAILNGLLRTNLEVGFSVLIPIGKSDVFFGPEIGFSFAVIPAVDLIGIINLPLRIILRIPFTETASLDAFVGTALNIWTGGGVSFNDLTVTVGARLDVNSILFGLQYTLPVTVPVGGRQLGADQSVIAYTANYWQNALSILIGYRIVLQ